MHYSYSKTSFGLRALNIQLFGINMKYRESKQDKKLRAKFLNDFSHRNLRRIELKEGAFRGLDSLDISFQYPITAIAGKNGSGKSTILALVCCAYHNNKDGFKLPKRKTNYYTFSDFFIQHSEEVPLEGIDIRYHIAHDRWKKTTFFPEGVGIAYQTRRKKKGGKWNDYDLRVKRNVVFLGIERIVPHSERSQSRSYSRSFMAGNPKDWEEKVKNAVGYILGRSYKKFRTLEYSKYSLPVVQVGDATYSGFNMGAGENALFEIFTAIYSCNEGAIIVLDEIELGLHSEAQRRFIERLKDVCFETHTQVICTTHSPEIFDCLPYDARFFVEKVNGKTRITQGISSDFAFSKLSAIPGEEVLIFVEDDVAKKILHSVLPSDIRSRVSIKIIGSASAISRQLAAIYVRGDIKPTLAIFDGDQKNKEKDNLSHAKSMCENHNEEFTAWFKNKINYLPGDTWPESWLVQHAAESLQELADIVSCDEEALSDILEYGLQAGKHNEFYEIAKHLGMERDMCLQYVTLSVTKKYADKFKYLVEHIKKVLSDAG